MSPHEPQTRSFPDLRDGAFARPARKSTASSAAAVRRSCCCTAIRRRTRCGTRSRRALASDYTVVCADLRGYGDSAQARERRRRTPTTRSARWRSTGRGDARARLPALSARRSRSRRACRASPVPRSSGRGRARRRARHLADADHVRRDRPGVRDGVLPLVLPDPAVRRSRAADRRRSHLLLHQKLGGWGRRLELLRARAMAEYERCFDDRPRFTRRARIIAPPPRSTSRTTTKTRPARSPARCSCSGAKRAWSTAVSIRSPTGGAVASDVRGERCHPVTISRKRRRRKRWRRSNVSSPMRARRFIGTSGLTSNCILLI